MKKQFSILAIMAVILLAALAASPVSANKGKGEVIGVTGIVPGQDLIVHIIALVPPGADRSEVAQQVLANQGARALTKEEFSTIALEWDQFFDADSGNDFVTQNYNPTDDPTSGQGLPALLATQATWTNVGSSSFVFASGDMAISRCPSLVKECRGRQTFDGNNDVAWLDLKDANTLGVTWSGTSIDEADMALNTKFTWATDGTDFDVQTVYLHENGHVVGLGHSDETGAIMEAIYDGVRRILHADDIAGITSVYPSGPVNAAPAISITSPADGGEFATGATIAFAGTATDAEDDLDANISVSVAWDSNGGNIGSGTAFNAILADGVHTITATATDSGGATATDSISIRVGPAPAEATFIDTVVVSYTTSGGKNNDKNLLITISVTDNLGAGVESASVSMALSNTDGGSWTGTGSTGAEGTVTFRLRNARDSTYSTIVTNVVAAGLDDWDGAYVDPGFTKSSGNNSRGSSGTLETQ